MADSKNSNEVCQHKQYDYYDHQGNSLTYIPIEGQSSEIIHHASVPLIQSTSALPE
jgi:hypothetical protein